MAIFADNFTGTDGTLLDAHAPDTGTSWTRLWGTAGTNAEINTNRVRSDGDLNSGVMYTADGTYPSADYDITCTMVTLVALNDRPIYLMVRIQDQENMYAVRLETTATESSLYKKVSGTWTAIGSLFTKPANGSVIKLEIIGTALKFYDDGVQLASATVSDISAAGKAGIGFGGGAELTNSLDDGDTTNVLDTLTVNNLGGGGSAYTQSASGAMTPAGAVLKQTNKPVAGAITPAGALAKQTNKPVAGTLTSAGAIIKSSAKAFAGAMTSSGAISKAVAKLFTGTLTSSGASAKGVNKSFTGTLTSAGTDTKQTAKTAAGATTPSGEISRQTNKAVAGVLTTSGAIVRAISKFVSGALSAAGALLLPASADVDGDVSLSDFTVYASTLSDYKIYSVTISDEGDSIMANPYYPYNSYLLGNAVTIQSAFSVSSTNTDPTTVTLELTDPSGNTDTFSTTDLTHSATGTYTYEVTPDEAGYWKYRFVGTGAVVAANSFKFVVVSA
jgi:hypothetical protein